MAAIQKKLARRKKVSRRWKRLMAAKGKIEGRAKRRIRDALHKISRAAVEWCKEAGVGLVALGDPEGVQHGTRNGPAKKRRSRKLTQQLARWEFGRLANYVEYKLAAVGITLLKQDEAYTSQTCPLCGRRTKVASRMYRCRYCGYTAPRDVVGAVNILNRGGEGIHPAPRVGVDSQGIPGIHSGEASKRWRAAS